MISKKITERDDQLLKREAGIRRERKICIGIGILGLVSMFLVPLIEQGEVFSRPAFNAIMLLLAYGYVCTLRLRHIETIKAYRANTGQVDKK